MPTPEKRTKRTDRIALLGVALGVILCVSLYAPSLQSEGIVRTITLSIVSVGLLGIAAWILHQVFRP